MFGDGGMVDARGEEQGDALGREGLYVDLVDADTVLRNDLQTGERLLDDRGGDQVVAADVAVELAHQRERVRFVERTAGGDNFPARFSQQLMVLARGVLEGGRREEDARLRHGNILVN